MFIPLGRVTANTEVRISHMYLFINKIENNTGCVPTAILDLNDCF